MKLVLIGDGQSPHLLKWARALAHEVSLYAVSSRGFTPEFEALLPPERRLALATDPRHAGGNISILKQLPRLGQWLQKVDADWLHAHYLTSHGTLAWAAKRGWKLRARIAGSAWGSDILVTPNQGWGYHWLTRKVLSACDVCTADSEHMGARMRELGAAEVMCFPFGLEAMPKQNVKKSPWLFFANRGLEPIYRPDHVIAAFATVAAQVPEARLVVANDGSLLDALTAQVHGLGLDQRVDFVGRLDAKTQGGHYARARWYLSLPESDSVSVSVLEAMAHECLPILSDLPANHELLRDGQGLLLKAHEDWSLPERLQALSAQADALGAANRAWVAKHGLFAPAVKTFLQRLQQFLSRA